jgi:hypothetical protein
LVAKIKCETSPEEEDERIGPLDYLYLEAFIKINTM